MNSTPLTMTAIGNTSEPVSVFYSYAHRDEDYREQLEKHLSVLRHNALISEWHDRKISAGTEWENEIDSHLNLADLILLLVSPDFVASRYCYSIEMTRALERHAAGEARVIPIVVRSVVWKGAPFGKLQALPTDAKAVDRWPNPDHAFENVATGIAKAVEEIRAVKRTRLPSQGRVDHEEGRDQDSAPTSTLSPIPTNLFKPGIKVSFNLPGISETFPATPENEVWRENMLYAIDTMFSGDCKIVVVEGKNGLGKTTLLSQFVRKRSREAISRFIRVSDPRTWDLEAVKDDLAAQVAEVLGVGIDEEKGSIREGDFSTLVFRLSRYARKRGQRFYLVLDGLHDLASESPETLRALIQLLPVGLSGISLLLSGSLAELRPYLPGSITVRPLQMLPFVPEETEKYLRDVGVSTSGAATLHRHLQGIPGNVASARRSIAKGTTIEALLASVPNSAQGLRDPGARLLEIEWTTVEEGDERLKEILALLAWDQRTHTVSEVASFAGMAEDELVSLISPIGMLRADRDSMVIEFASEDLAELSRNKLRELQRTISDRVIEQLVMEGDSYTSQMYLPNYLEQAGEYEKLLKYLSPSYFARMLEQAGSLLPVKQKVALGLSSAIQLGNDGDSLRFGMQRSVLSEFSGTEVWRTEVEARIALDDYEAAIGIAQAAPVLEDRLHLLAVISRKQREKGIVPEATLVEQMQQLCAEIRYPLDATRAQDIAEDLIHSLPEQALELVEKAARVEKGENATDLAFALLSIAALEVSSEAARSDALRSISNRISDPQYRNISKGASLLFSECSASELTSQLKDFEQVSHQMLVLQEWIRLNAERADAIEAAEYALSLALGSSSYNLTLPVLKSISAALPAAEDVSKASAIVAIVDAQVEVTAHKGSTEDFVEVQLLLAHAQMSSDEVAAVNRIVNVILMVSDLPDAGIRAACAARVVGTLEKIDRHRKLEDREGLHTVADEVYSTSADSMLIDTADHYAIAKPALKALASRSLSAANDLAGRLNIGPRRDAARQLIVQSRRENGDLSRSLPEVLQVIAAIESPLFRDDAVAEAFRALGSEDRESGVELSDLESLLTLLPKVVDAETRCRASTWAFHALSKHAPGSLADRRAELADVLANAWQSIDIAWLRVRVAFKISEALSTVDQELALEYLRRAEELREALHADAVVSGETYESSVRVALRAYSGLLRQELAEPDDFHRITQLIRRVPASGERAVLWAEVALRAFVAGGKDVSEEVVNDQIYPAIEAIPKGDSSYRAWVVSRTAPALYSANHRTSVELLQRLPHEYRDAGCRNVISFATNRRVFTDPFEPSVSPGGELSWADLVDLCDVLQCIHSDTSLQICVATLAHFMVPDHGRSTYTDNQRHDIAGRIRRICEAKLPCPGSIEHHGYIVSTGAAIARIEGASKDEWERLIEQARLIPNLADKALVLSLIAREAVDRRVRDLREPLLLEAERVVEQVPSAYDRTSRLQEIGELALKLNSQIARRVLRRAWDVAIENKEKDLRTRQREILDLAHRVDSDFAESLAKLADDDPVRRSNQDSIQGRLRVLQAKKSLLTGQVDEEDLNRLSDSNFLSTIELHLGALAAGNAPTLSVPDTRRVVERASRIPFGKADVVYAWAIENAIRRPAPPAVARRYLRPMFEGAVTGAEFASQMGLRHSGQEPSALLSRKGLNETITFGPGQGRAAVQFIVEWVRDSEEQHLTIIEPEFSPDGLELIRRITIESPSTEIEIVSSRKFHEQTSAASWEEAYREAWRQLTEQAPPDARIIITGESATGLLPVDTRCILAGDRGLATSGSICSLGDDDVVITPMSPIEVRQTEEEIRPILQMKSRMPGTDHVLRYTVFSLQ